MIEQQLDPRVRTVWALGGSLTVVLLSLVGLVVSVVLKAPSWVYPLIVAAALALIAVSLGSAALSYRSWRYVVGEDGIELRHGVLVRRISLIPYHRIQQIDVRRGLVERGYGLSTLVLRTAAATSDATIPGMSEQNAQPLRMDLLSRAGVSDAV